MSNSVFPVLPGRMWDTAMQPIFNTKVHTSVNLNELRASFTAAPIYHFKLSYDLLRDTVANPEIRTLLGFFALMQGRWDSFLYEHPDDHVATAQSFGTGDGVTANFNLSRTFGSFSERVANANVVSQITVSNTPTSNYTLSSQGVVQFTSPPAFNAPLAWTGTYYYRCRFTNDAQDFNQFMSQLWNVKTLEFDGCLGTKL